MEEIQEIQEKKIVKCSYIKPRKTLHVKRLEENENPESDKPRILTPAEKGFELEELLYKASLKLPGLTHSFRENELKKHFNDNSLNGIDHWIQIGETHIFIQDKWKQSHNQQEVSQFLNCATRIQLRLGENSKIHLLWVSKVAPTSNSLKMLQERKAHIIIQETSTDDLAKLSIRKILEIVSDDLF
jgi:hypothetical protein